MSYECSDILFEFFFLNEKSIAWSSRRFDLGLEVHATGQGGSQALLAVETGQLTNFDTRFAVAVEGESVSAAEFEIQAISISALHLAVEAGGWTDSGIGLELIGPGVERRHQMLMTVREAERFTN